MPPANSPSNTRPSTPPTNTLNAEPYLRQLEEAISTPVPDLASTLNLSDIEPGPEQDRRMSAASNPPSHLGPTGRGATSWERAEIASRGVVESDRSLDLPVPVQIFTRARDPIDAAIPTWARANRPQEDMQSQRPSRTVQGQNYATTGGGPVRESLYDWAVSATPGRDEQDSDSGEESDEDMEHMSTAAPNNDINARRDLQRLERALQSYRSARNALRTGRTADLLGSVPTASALRAYWNEDSNDSSATTSGFQSQYRFERQRRHAEYARINAEANAIYTDARSRVRKQPKRSEAFDRVRNSIRYLSQLRHTGVEGGLKLARDLDLDYLYEDERANTPSDLPMHVNSLPMPQYSSWLAPGMVWHGLQSTDREPVRANLNWGSQARRERHRELFRRTLARRREMVLGNDVAEEFSGSLLDAERYLSDLLQDGNGRWGFARSSTPPFSQSNTTLTPPTETDHWPVKVAIHSVDYNTMTLTGTMSASHMPEKVSPPQQPNSQSHTASTSMSSYFTGEIIDFRRHPLETEAEDRDYRVGGVDIDASYWARLGPFRKEIEKARSLRGKKRSEYQQDSPLWDAFRKAAGGESDNKEVNSTVSNEHDDRDVDMSGGNHTSSEDPAGNASIETEESQEIEDDKVMARCLGSAKWLDEKIGKEWILMRWKERCFVDSPSNSNQTRTIVTAPYTYSTSPTSLSRPPEPNTNGTSWGLTISGFYYIALNRLTGEIDGLYYDPGSQPYQALKMAPEGMSVQGVDAGARSQPDIAPSTAGLGCGCGEESCKERVGLKRWFPSMELR
ncbi:hypothetical protein PV11_07822 [Exophiala sideris]|uniref:Post-SET domain-containing protein n=1 Tax=Exophiala sideris TaxID=1016849 RepID=A0A0D1WYR4_9EURO|nr:hypothetical protein PV11_07822 [Exophiala sideris]